MDDYRKTFQRINALLDRAGRDGIDDLIRAQLAQLICVLASGAIEIACQTVLGNHCDGVSSSRAARFARKQLAGFMNPNPNKIKDLIASFDQEWVAKVEAFWDGEVRDSIGSLVRNRHLISHGKTTTVSLAQVKPWVKCAEKFCARLEEIVNA